MSSQKLWVEHQTAERSFVTKVSIEGCDYIAQFLDVIRQRPQLAIPQNASITLYKPDGTEIDVGDSLALLVAGNSTSTPLVVKTVAVVRRSRQSGIKTSQWEISTLAQLEYDITSPLFELDSDHLAKTGVATEKLVLYRRPAFYEQFKFLRERVIDESVLGWIFGPPGTGKSATALAFASTLDRNEWVVTWVHLEENDYPSCVRWEGGFMKSCEIYKSNVYELDEILEEVDCLKQHIVFLDGYTENGIKHIDVQHACCCWFERDRVKRRLVVIGSMTSRYKSKPEEDMLLNLEEFFVYSWKKQEYLDAVGNQIFFNHVKSVLDTYLSSESSPSPEDLVLSKMYFAGASARWMFLFPTKIIIERTDKSVASVGDIIPYIQGAIGGLSTNVLSRLFSTSYDPHDTFYRKTSIISRFAGVMLAIKVGPDLIRRLTKAARHERNPSMDDWMLEMWFFACLRHGGVKLLDNSDEEFQTWPESNVKTVDITTIPTLPEMNGVWFKPSKWNQGGFDAIFLEKRNGLVRFVQVSDGDTHSFKIEYFYSFLRSLSESTETFPVTCLEIFFVVDRKKRSTFVLAEPSGLGLLKPFGWDYGKEKERVKIVYVSGWSDQ